MVKNNSLPSNDSQSKKKLFARTLFCLWWTWKFILSSLDVFIVLIKPKKVCLKTFQPFCSLLYSVSIAMRINDGLTWSQCVWKLGWDSPTLFLLFHTTSDVTADLLDEAHQTWTMKVHFRWDLIYFIVNTFTLEKYYQ